MHVPALFLAAGFLISSASAQQPFIFLDAGSTDPANGTGVPSNGYAAAAPIGGVWNALDSVDFVGLSTFTSAPLLDAGGAATGVTVTYVALTGTLEDFSSDDGSTFGDDEALMDDISFGNGATELRFDGLPAGLYDVYTYAMDPSPSPGFVTSVNVTTSSDGIQDVGGNFSGGFVQGTTHAFHTATVTAGQPLIIEVDTASFANSLNGVQILPTGVGGSVGSSYCGPAPANSSGASARMVATGSDVAADNDLTINCFDMPPFAFGFFILSDQMGFVANPGGSEGNLCVSGSIGRYVGPGQLQNSGASGQISLVLDLTSTPQPTGPISIQSGSTWHWQAWFRDSVMGQASSNLSDGLQVDFQ